MRIVFIDLETTGLPKQLTFDEYYCYTKSKYYDSSRIVQIAIVICDFSTISMECKQLATYNYIVKPDGFEINNSHIHKIDTKLAISNGTPFSTIIEKIAPDLFACDVMIAHNILFDRNIFLSELHRYKFNNLIYKINSMKYFCTSRGCAAVTKIRYNANKFKQPKLSELYKFLFKKNIIVTHNALDDTNILVECFIELCKTKILKYIDGAFTI